MHWSYKYLGIPWVAGGREGNQLDCWGLVRLVYKEEFGIELPLNIIDPSVLLKVSRGIKSNLPNWIELDEPEDNCGVVFFRRQIPYHIGIYIEEQGGIILHSSDNKHSACQPLRELKQEGMTQVKFYRHGSIRNHKEPPSRSRDD